MIGRWLRMFWTRKSRPSSDAAAAHHRAEESLATARTERARAQRLREVAMEAEAAVRSHNTANRYARWLEEQVRGNQ